MRQIQVPIVEKYIEDGKLKTKQVNQLENIYQIKELSYLGKLLSCKESTKREIYFKDGKKSYRQIHYLELPCAFDIETTNITEDPEGVSQETFVDENVSKYIKACKFKYSDNIKADIADFEQLRKKYFGKIKLSKKTGTPIDSIYVDLNYKWPYLFPEEITNESDQLIQILKVYDENTIAKSKFRPFAFMYHWQFCLDDEVCFGRTWEEFTTLLHALEVNLHLSINNRLVIWVHNLGFEWQFMRNFLEFEDGFFLDERAPARILTKSGIEFRCSYALSNMSLSKFCENEEDVIHYKLDGDTYEYELLRTPKSVMSEYEEGYCYNDVRGLCECIRSRQKQDTFARMPMTSTGYVRRELRCNVRKNKKNRESFLNAKLDKHLYTLCREAFRGGDTHANSNRADQINKKAWGEDRKSAYPAEIVMFDGYPFSAWAKMDVPYYLNHDTSEFALIFKVAFFNIKYNTKSEYFCGMPYIALAKCNKYSSRRVIDNGRVIFSEFLECTLTNLDLEIIKREYVWDDLKVGEIWASKASMLSQEIRDTTMDYFRAKTLLDGDNTKLYEYSKSKNKLNSIFGCMVMKIDQSCIKWDPLKKIYVDETPDLEAALQKFYDSRNNFLRYDQGLFITAAARYHLREMLWTVGKDCIYCDTDSIKGIGDHFHEFEEVNIALREKALKMGAYAEDKHGDIKYLGIWENETKECLYDEFITMGAKKYAYRQGETIKSTIAGVSKKAGAAYFTEHGLKEFKRDTVIPDSGHLSAFYNDDEIHKITIDHCSFTTSSNVALVNTTYKLGVTGEYSDLLIKGIENMIDML